MRPTIRCLVLAALLGAPCSGSAQEPTERYEWLDGLTLFVLDSDDVAALHAAHAAIRAQGGRVAILSPPSVLLGWMPPAKSAGLVGRAHIAAVHRDAVDAQALSRGDRQTELVVEYFNRVVRGEVRPQPDVQKPRSWGGAGDTRQAEPLEELAYLQNLQANGFDPGQLAQRGLLLGKSGPNGSIQGNSDRMTGTVTVTLLFVESDGTGADPNSYTWTDADVQSYVNGVNTGLAWWSSQAEQVSDCWVGFFVRYVAPTDSRCQQWREMVLHPSGDVAAMASDIMAKFGYSSGSHSTRVNAFNTAQRATYGTTWAYTAFVAYNPVPAPDRLTNGTSAFAYLLGPYTFLLFRSYGWQPAQVFPHESGHIFGACDEYADGCSCGAICIDQPNGNCETCGGGTTCMMRLNTYTMCSYTDDQLGWHDTTPCAPPPLTPPTATSIQPGTGYQGTTVQVSIAAQNLLYGAFAGLGSGVTVQSTTLVGSTTLQLTLAIDANAAPGPRDVVVSNRDLQSSTLAGAFQVRPTTRHYYAPAGGNVYPYHTPATAAQVLSDAIAAAAVGDSVLVGSGTLPLGSLLLGKGILLSGAWNPAFTSRDPVNAKSVLDLTGNVIIAVTGSGTGALDGFELRNGRGNAGNTPYSGHYGGALFIIGSTALVANCEIHASQATTISDFGGGGGIFATNSTVTLTANSIHHNTATRGGGIYLHASSGSLVGNTVTNNAVSAGSQAPRGAGIVLDGCSNVTLQDNVVDGNTGAEQGGGLYIVGSTNVSIQGGSVAHHTVTNSGGGARLDASGVAFVGVRFERNTSSWTEGGILAASGSTLTLDECDFLWNSAVLYPGVHATGPAASVRHNLFLGNSAFVGGALGLDNLVSGEVTGNTLDRNAATSSGAGGIVLTSTPIEVTNNIVANTTGDGISCSGTLPTLLAYNLVWNTSGAAYTGCSPGTGSLAAAPLFADTTAVDYRLAAHSPAIDAGRPEPGYEDPDGSPGDLGLYGSHSFVMQQPSRPQGLTAQMSGGNRVLRWPANPEPDVVQYAVYCDSVLGFKPGTANFVQFVASPDTTLTLGPPGGLTVYTLAAIDASGYSSGFATQAELQPTDVLAAPGAWRFRLHPNVPNPFNPRTTLRFELDRAGPVRLEVFDLSGRSVRVLVHGPRDAGPHGVVWDGRDARGLHVPSGVYLVRLEAAAGETSKKVTLLK